ncbi:DUF6153 family protein [Leifsonia sp. NPDC014704]|uniref:DUF6153 family protein n=1 Tax=Leifsonia virtsii TaxID=3035915 RepID=A0ABT8J2M4_9MICO|nr:DUF6153 family protein [Leifsonia virtsii]MDN4599328.1 DUF6153 family protein [Leifsonia virtsii]
MVSNSIRLPRLAPLQRVVMLLLAVTGTLIGLLAMHTLTTVTGDHTSHHATAINVDGAPATLVDHHAMSDSGMTGGAVMTDTNTSNDAHGVGDCNGMCEPGHTMANMACLLALLILTLILTLRVITTRSGNALHRLIAALTATLPAVLAPPAPPSLHVLSISRT